MIKKILLIFILLVATGIQNFHTSEVKAQADSSLPVVNSITNITDHSATLSAYVDIPVHVTEVYFVYWKENHEAQKVQSSKRRMSQTGTIFINIDGLQANTKYVIQAMAEIQLNNFGTESSGLSEFTTLPSPPKPVLYGNDISDSQITSGQNGSSSGQSQNSNQNNPNVDGSGTSSKNSSLGSDTEGKSLIANLTTYRNLYPSNAENQFAEIIFSTTKETVSLGESSTLVCTIRNKSRSSLKDVIVSIAPNKDIEIAPKNMADGSYREIVGILLPNETQSFVVTADSSRKTTDILVSSCKLTFTAPDTSSQNLTAYSLSAVIGEITGTGTTTKNVNKEGSNFFPNKWYEWILIFVIIFFIVLIIRIIIKKRNDIKELENKVNEINPSEEMNFDISRKPKPISEDTDSGIIKAPTTPDMNKDGIIDEEDIGVELPT